MFKRNIWALATLGLSISLLLTQWRFTLLRKEYAAHKASGDFGLALAAVEQSGFSNVVILISATKGGAGAGLMVSNKTIVPIHPWELQWTNVVQ